VGIFAGKMVAAVILAQFIVGDSQVLVPRCVAGEIGAALAG
jgi:hypothetical protein